MGILLIIVFVIITWDLVGEPLMELLGELLGLLFEGLGSLIGQLFELLWLALKALCRASILLGKKAGHGLKASAIFLYYLADEALRGSAEPEYEEYDQEDEDSLQLAIGSYEHSLNLLGLVTNCSQEEFTRAYRQAMARAHPDKGGTHEQALMLNEAREIVKRHNGWR